tara:strand:+ start:1007 stop:1147 length:141 start_codon:yes stop_codon:yes gene_type:complete
MTGSIEQVMDMWMELLIYDTHLSQTHLQKISESLERIANVMDGAEE